MPRTKAQLSRANRKRQYSAICKGLFTAHGGVLNGSDQSELDKWLAEVEKAGGYLKWVANEPR